VPPTPFVHRHRVTYAECTLGNHVYHSRYLDLLEAARGEFLRVAGQPFAAWQENGVVFPIIGCRLEFLQMARYDDELAIEVRLARLRGARMNFAYMVRNARGEPVLTGETCHVCAGLDEKPRRLPPELLAALQPWLAPAEAVEI
jgi:acyl-CoA thioester hydrolase